MNRRLISAHLIPVFLLYTFYAGCLSLPTKTEKVFPAHANLVNEKIVGVVTQKGEKVLFEVSGGYVGEFLCAGETVEGKKITLTSDAVSEVRLSLPDSISWDLIGDRFVTEVITTDGKCVEFGDDGGRFFKTGFIAGKVKSGSGNYFAKPDLRQVRVTRPKVTTIQQILMDSTLKVVELVSKDNRVYTFNGNGCEISDRRFVISGVTTRDHQFVQIPLQDVLYVQVERADPAGQAVAVFLNIVLVTALVVGIIGLIIVATKESCPFVYSYDGSRYVFDAEPLGGATTKSLARTDYSRLEFLKPVENKYKLLVRNEVNETQYLDRISLLQVDHDSTVQVVADQQGMFHAVHTPWPAFAASDEQGNSVLPFVVRQDSIFWQTNMESALRDSGRPLRHTLTLSFQKRHAAQKAALIVHGGTTMWGSNMIREMYGLYGTSLDEYHKALDEKRPEFYRMLQFMDREELYETKVYVKNDTGWTHRGTIRGGGPYVYETQFIPISLKHTVGDTVTLQIHPPAGFWAIDFIGIQYDADVTLPAKEIFPSQAVDQDGRDVLSSLSDEDEIMTVMPTTNDEFTLEFPVSNEPPRQARALFLKTTGYYELNFHPDTPPATEVLRWIDSKSGAIIEYSYQLFRQWRSSFATH